MMGILVDLDGVLWFSESAHKIAFKKALAPLIPNAVELVDQTWQFGESTDQYLERILSICNLKISESAVTNIKVQKRKFAAQIKDIPLNEILIHSLRSVKNSELLIALVSSSSPSNVQKFLESAQLVNFFDFIVDSSMVSAPKPNPDCYSLAMKELGLRPQECIAIEDSETGRKSAMSAGISRVKIYPRDFSDPGLIDFFLNDLGNLF